MSFAKAGLEGANSIGDVRVELTGTNSLPHSLERFDQFLPVLDPDGGLALGKLQRLIPIFDPDDNRPILVLQPPRTDAGANGRFRNFVARFIAEDRKSTRLNSSQ